MGHSRPLFLYFRLFCKQLPVDNCSIKVASDWFRTRVFWIRKQPRCQLCHNHCPAAVKEFNWLKLVSWAVVVISVLTLYSDDPSSNPAEAYSFFRKIVFEKNKNKQKEAGVGPLFWNWSRGLQIIVLYFWSASLKLLLLHLYFWVEIVFILK